MKLGFLISACSLVVLISTFNVARAATESCPSLEGHYHCVHQNMVGEYNLTVTRTSLEAADHFTFFNEHNHVKNEYTSDAQTYNFIDNGFYVELVSTCKDNSLLANENALQKDQDFRVIQNSTFKLVDTGNLLIQVDYYSEFQGQDHSKGTYFVKCSRL